MNNKQYISDYYRELGERIREEIMTMRDEDLLCTDTDELVDYYLSHNCLTPIEIDTAREEHIQPRKTMRLVPASQRESGYQYEDVNFEFEELILVIPLIPNEHIRIINSLESSTHFMSGSSEKVSWADNHISIIFAIKGYGYNHSDESIQRKIVAEKGRVIQQIGQKNQDIKKENNQLKEKLTSFIESRKVKLNADKDRFKNLTEKINIPLRKKENEAAQRIKLNPKPIVKKVRPLPKKPEEYVLDQKEVLDVIELIDNQGKQFEMTPKTYENLGEEQLRDILLATLNSLFEGKATGESFSKTGKTDIYLNIDKGKILVFECKIWGGKKLYSEAIDQLLGYVTWRHNFGVIITFVRQKNFSQTLSQIEEIVSNHKTYKNSFKKISETHFTSSHQLPEDDGKELKLHHLFYNLHC